MRVNGKNWHSTRAPFRSTPSANSTSTQAKARAYTLRTQISSSLAATKAKEAELKSEKEAERQERTQKIRDKRAAKVEKERFEKMAEKMHAKRVDRLRRREKRNKMLKS